VLYINNFNLKTKLILKIIVSLILLFAVPSCSGLNLTNVDGSWSLAGPGTNPTCPSCIGYANTPADTANENIVGYGGYYVGDTFTCPTTKPNFDRQSGFGFDGSGKQQILPGQIINLGVFRHHNKPINTLCPLQYVTLTIVLDIEGLSTDPSFSYKMNLHETTNWDDGCDGTCPTGTDGTRCCYWNTALSPDDWECRGTGCTSTYCDGTPVRSRRCCQDSDTANDDYPPYCRYTPCNAECPDRVWWDNTGSSTTFTIDGKSYTLQILGFAACSDPNSAINSFVTQEGVDNYACLYGRITGNTPSIHIEKYTNGTDVSSPTDPDRPTFNSGCPVLWTYKVTNDGNVDLHIADVTDNITGRLDPTYYVGGDVNYDSWLNLTELWIYNRTGTAISCGSEDCECDYANNVTVNGTYSGGSVTDNDTSYYHAVQTRINAGSDQSVCEIPNGTMLTGTSSCAPEGLVTYKWTTNGTGVFNDSTKLIANYTWSFSDVLKGIVGFRLYSNGTCPAATASDIMNLTIVKKPNVVIEVIEPKQN